MNAVVQHVETEIAETAQQSHAVDLFERLARDPAVDVDKLERLMAMNERMLERQAQAEFANALADMQNDLPVVQERGNANGRYRYALWEDINSAIKPLLKKHGFSLSFRTDFTDGIAVTGVLTHRNGHSESTTIKLPADPSGNKNAVQAVASSVSYGKRYTAGALLNLTSTDEDDDGAEAGATPRMTDQHALEIEARANEYSADMLERVLKSYKAKALGEIPDSEYPSIMGRLADYLKRKNAP